MRNGQYLKETQFGRSEGELALPGLRDFDGSYTEITIHWNELEIHVESAVDGDDILLLVTPEKQQMYPATLVLETAYLWNRPGYTVFEDSVITAHSMGTTRIIRSTGVTTRDLNIPIQTPCIQVILDKTVTVYTGKERSIEQISQTIAQARQNVMKKYVKNLDIISSLSATNNG